MASAERRRSKSSRHRRPSREQKPAVPEHSLPRGVSDRLVLSQTDQILAGAALLVLVSGTATARHLIRACPHVTWKIFTCEHFYLTAVVNALSEHDSPTSTSADIELFCTPDLPTGKFDTVILPLDSRGSLELTHDLLQAIAGRLTPCGRLILATNNARDHRLHEHLKATFGRITVINDDQGICFIARTSGKPGKQKDYRSEFAFRDGERLIRCASRPGVFGHRRVEAGARALVRSLDLLTADPWSGKPPRRIVEMGCGGGAVAVAAALRYPQAKVLAVDSHARAVQSTEVTAELNAARNVSILLTSDGRVPDPGQHDLYLCNPPYYSDFRISELFLQSAAAALRPGGRIHLVTKHADWHENRMIEIFANAVVHPFGACSVIVSRR